MPLHRSTLRATVLIALAGLASGDEPRPKAQQGAANRLAKETSPYLLLHAHNPVDWHPWGPEAFAKAKAEDKPIFLSVGYSACYWCHVMERESFMDPEVAKAINDGVRRDQGRPRGAARRRPGLHDRRPGVQRLGRLADVGLHDARRPAVLRRDVLPAQGRLPGPAQGRPKPGATTGPALEKDANNSWPTPSAGPRPAPSG